MELKLNNKKALVTGSTAGIGLEIARKLATEGASVILSGRDQAKLDQAVDSVVSSGASDVDSIRADITTPQGTAELIEKLPEVDILINNLGINENKAFADITDADWQRYFDVNVMSGVRLTRSYFSRMLEKKGGSRRFRFERDRPRRRSGHDPLRDD